jgi:hypothetical protein
MASQLKGRTRRGGRLPQRVYWFRRSVVLLVAALLVFGVGKMLGGSGSGPATDQASATASTPSSSAGTSRAIGPVAPTKVPATAATTAPLLAPTGACAADEVSVVPTVPKAEAGKPIVVHLTLAGTQPACTFAVSPDSLVVKITSGADRIWSSQDCPGAIPRTSVVVRSGVAADVPISWSGRRSDSTCSNAESWAMPGFYHVYAAALGSSPGDVQFEVTYPLRGVVTKTAKPKKASATPSPGATATAKPSVKQPAKATTPTPSPSAAVKGKQSTCAAGSC